jgi:hypothetical protein
MGLTTSIIGLLATAIVVGAGSVNVGGMSFSSPMKGVSFQRMKAFREPAADAPAAYYQTLKSVKSRSNTRSAARAFSALAKSGPGGDISNITALTEWSTQYAIEVDWDGQPVDLILDTGSADTWATRSDFSCVSRLGTEYPQEACQFGPHAIESFKDGEDPMLHLAVGYGSGEFITGPLGKVNLTVAGLEVKDQLCGLANRTFWFGNNETNGIIGLAYPALTSAYYGNSTEGRPQFSSQYTPFFTTLVNQGEIEPYFSVALSRHSSEGVIAWGGLPPMETSGAAAYADLIIVSPIALADIFRS